jgi:hypothetical protein
MKRLAFITLIATFSISANAFDDNFSNMGITPNASQMKALGRHSCSGTFTPGDRVVYIAANFNTNGAGRYTSGSLTETFLIPGQNPFTCNFVLDSTKISKYTVGADGRGFAFHYWTPNTLTAQNPSNNAPSGLCDVPLRNQIASYSSFTGSTTFTLKNVKAVHFIDNQFNLSNNAQAVPVDLFCD